MTYRVGEKDRGVRLDRFLKERIPRMSRESIKKAIATRVAVPGRPSVHPSTALRIGEAVVVTYPDRMEGENGPAIPVLFSDDDLLVVDKPAGLLVHSTASSRGSSLLGLLTARGAGVLHLVHRLDRETSGVVVLARTTEGARSLSRAFASGAIRKIYVAIVFGNVDREEGIVDLPLGKALGSSIHVKQGVRRDSGRSAVTGWRVIERLERLTMLEIRPRTGRRHQIRVHMQAIGHPVVGDKLYAARESHHVSAATGGFDERMARELLSGRQLLHAARVCLPHPRDGRPLRIEAPVPADFEAFLEERRRPARAP